MSSLARVGCSASWANASPIVMCPSPPWLANIAARDDLLVRCGMAVKFSNLKLAAAILAGRPTPHEARRSREWTWIDLAESARFGGYDIPAKWGRPILALKDKALLIPTGARGSHGAGHAREVWYAKQIAAILASDHPETFVVDEAAFRRTCAAATARDEKAKWAKFERNRPGKRATGGTVDGIPWEVAQGPDGRLWLAIDDNWSVVGYSTVSSVEAKAKSGAASLANARRRTA